VGACGDRFFFFSSRRRHTRLVSDWSSDVCSSDLGLGGLPPAGLPPPTPAQPARQAAQAWRVLVVDDNRDMADSAAILLRASGHDVRVAYSGKAALEAARAHRPDAVLLDLGLPEIDGYEVARRLRQDPQLKNARLIAVSGYGQETDRQRSREAGFDAHLVKPVDLQKVQVILAALMK